MRRVPRGVLIGGRVVSVRDRGGRHSVLLLLLLLLMMMVVVVMVVMIMVRVRHVLGGM